MNSTQFNNYDRNYKFRLLYYRALEIDNFITKSGEELLVTTYALNDFFVEMIFDFYKKQFKSIKAYDSSMYLEKYPDQSLKMNNLLKSLNI
jgi:hypothetical protein